MLLRVGRARLCRSMPQVSRVKIASKPGEEAVRISSQSRQRSQGNMMDESSRHGRKLIDQTSWKMPNRDNTCSKCFVSSFKMHGGLSEDHYAHRSGLENKLSLRFKR